VFGFWLLQGEWDGGAQEFEGAALRRCGYGEQVEAGFVAMSAGEVPHTMSLSIDAPEWLGG